MTIIEPFNQPKKELKFDQQVLAKYEKPFSEKLKVVFYLLIIVFSIVVIIDTIKSIQTQTTALDLNQSYVQGINDTVNVLVFNANKYGYISLPIYDNVTSTTKNVQFININICRQEIDRIAKENGMVRK